MKSYEIMYVLNYVSPLSSYYELIVEGKNLFELYII